MNKINEIKIENPCQTVPCSRDKNTVNHWRQFGQCPSWASSEYVFVSNYQTESLSDSPSIFTTEPWLLQTIHVTEWQSSYTIMSLNTQHCTQLITCKL